MIQKPELCFIGFGNMAQAIANGLNPSDYLAVKAADPSLSNPPAFIQAFEQNKKACQHADIIVLAVKPQQIQAACESIAAYIKADALIISVAAGITIDKLGNYLGSDVAIARAMPNTPALVQTAATGLYANDNVSQAQKQYAHQLFSSIGLAQWVEQETLIDAVTALSGSGPAYAFLLIEAMQNAAVELGLSNDMARDFAIQTCKGAAHMASETIEPVSELRKKVTSPGGTTAAAIDVLVKNDFTSLVKQAMIAAVKRAQQLAQQ